jgi:SWI/SNF-related matrix-associated actin-dependent regulator of chromatin subfamily B member 1
LLEHPLTPTPKDPLITPEIFAQSLVDDFKLASHHGSTIAKAVHEQLMEHDGSSEDAGAEAEAIPLGGESGDPGADDGRERGALDGVGEVWWRCWRKRIRTEDGYVKLGGEESEGDVEAEEEGDADDEAAGAKQKTRRRRRRARGRKFGVMVPEIMGDLPMDVDEIAVDSSGIDEEMRILIKVRVLSV